jgi:DNA polymerase IIIc chi subunit
LCSDSVNFVKNQLIPLNEKLYQYIDVTFIPFAQGNISTNNNTTIYTCHREQPECDADRVHACAIENITDKNKILKFVNCALIEASNNSNNSNELINKCGKQTDINENIINTITNCVSNTTESNKLLDNYYKMSRNANITNVPTIVINKKYTEENQKEALENFKKVACRYIPDSSNLEECKSATGGSSTVIVGVLPILTSVYYIINMF